MGTAGLKIKFVPVMKDFHKDSSQCCLEIVPEISDIQNIDQIAWKKDNNLIEYTIPMTYKIILKKLPRQTLKEINENLNKIYYSCVDLLLPSSVTKFDLASGDVKRIISDTYVVTSVASNLNYIEDTQRLFLNINGQNNIIESANKQNTIHEDPFKEQINKSLNHNHETREDIENHNDENGKAREDTSGLNTDDTNRKSMDKITNTESDFALCTDACTQSGETITCISTNMNSTSKGNSDRRLSQTPVCSIDADIVKEDVTPNSVIYYFNEINKNATCFANICTINNIYNKNYKQYKLFSKDFHHNYTNNKYFSRRKRILPEVRVAELVQIMEKEIMPLKIMLDEILCKCATLGTMCKISPISLLYKTIDSNFNERVKQCCKKQIKSNRVVYSIVFTG